MKNTLRSHHFWTFNRYTTLIYNYHYHYHYHYNYSYNHYNYNYNYHNYNYGYKYKYKYKYEYKYKYKYKYHHHHYTTLHHTTPHCFVWLRASDSTFTWDLSTVPSCPPC